MAIGSMTTNSTVDMIDKTLKTENAPADAAAVGDFILDRTKNPPQPIFYSKAAVDKLLAEKLGLHGTADNSAKWGGYERRFNEVTGSTHVLVETDGKYVDLRPAESIGLTAIVTSGLNYARLGDGTQICWGHITFGKMNAMSATFSKFVFAVPFSNTDYAIMSLQTGDVGDTSSLLVNLVIKTTTDATVSVYNNKDHSNNAGVIHDCIAIGRWK